MSKMDVSAKNSPCKEFNQDEGVQLQIEVEHLRQHLAERDSHIVTLETEFYKLTSKVNDLDEQVDTWQEKYERLYDSHKRVQKLNQVLEDKLLQMVDKMKGEKSQLTKDIATLSVRLAESKHNFSMLQKENERYKNDMNLAIQLLQCKPDNFVSQKLDNLSTDTQARVTQYVMAKSVKPSSSSQVRNGNENESLEFSEYEFNVSASLMSKILEDSIQDTVTKHCDTCTCNKTQNKPFCYNESFYSVSTQTQLTGEIKNSLCINCNDENKSINSNISVRNLSPILKLADDVSNSFGLSSPVKIPQIEKPKAIESASDVLKSFKTKPDTVESHLQQIPKLEDLPEFSKSNSVRIEPTVHHKLCDRTKNSSSSKKSSVLSTGTEDLLTRDIIPNETKSRNDNQSVDTISIRKNSMNSMGAVSRTSSIAKSTVSTHKSNNIVGPGPRFCHLRVQAGSKNILLDNAEPDVPPVLYRRQSKSNDLTNFKDIHDVIDNFTDMNKNHEVQKNYVKLDNVVVESTLVDVHVDSNVKDYNNTVKNTTINPALLNVSSSPLQPLKTHTFSNSSGTQQNNTQSVESQPNAIDINSLLNDFSTDLSTRSDNKEKEESKKVQNETPTDEKNVKIFNFDRYEQKIAGNLSRPLRKIDMSQLSSIEKTKISKDLPPQGMLPKLDKKTNSAAKSSLPAVVNVYNNLTQTHLKANESKKVFTNEQSTSSLSSDDSAAMLQKQQLLRVAEWVEKNLELQNYNDPLDDEVNFNHKTSRRDSKLNRLSETLNEIALNMPHPVSKFSKALQRDDSNNWLQNGAQAGVQEKPATHVKVAKKIVKETIFPVECDAVVTQVTNNDQMQSRSAYDVAKDIRETFESNGDKPISREELARMEYNVKQFLLNGPQWANLGSLSRSRRTSSKTETDV